MITYAKRGKALNALKTLPLDHIMLETDSPYMTPQKYQGQPNQPAYIIETAKKVAEVKNIALETVITQTTTNAQQFFKLPTQNK